MSEGVAEAGLGILVPGRLRKAQVAEAERGSQTDSLELGLFSPSAV